VTARALVRQSWLSCAAFVTSTVAVWQFTASHAAPHLALIMDYG